MQTLDYVCVLLDEVHERLLMLRDDPGNDGQFSSGVDLVMSLNVFQIWRGHSV